MVNCAVLTCKNDSRRQTKQNSNITFHRFPKREDLLNKWVEALQRPNWEPTIRSFVCSAHFVPSSMFLSKRGLRKLIPDAVPEIFNNEEAKPKKRKERSSSRINIPHMYVGYSPDDTKRKHKGNNKKNLNLNLNLNSVRREKVEIKVTSFKKDEFSPNSKDSANQQKLKKRIMNLTKLAKRRRLRCNALYAGLNRIKKKVTAVTQVMKDLQQKTSVNEELSRALESCGVSTADLFKGLWKKEKLEEMDEGDDFFYSELPNDIENFVNSQNSAPKSKIMVYTMSVPDNEEDLDNTDTHLSDKEKCEDSAVKTESSGFEPATVPGDCRICLVNNVEVFAIGSELKEFYETLTKSKLDACGVPVTLCAACNARFQASVRFAETASKAESYYLHKGPVEETSEQHRDPVDVKIETAGFGIQPEVDAWSIIVTNMADDSD